jgi:hypothetical protein
MGIVAGVSEQGTAADCIGEDCEDTSHVATQIARV